MTPAKKPGKEKPQETPTDAPSVDPEKRAVVVTVSETAQRSALATVTGWAKSFGARVGSCFKSTDNAKKEIASPQKKEDGPKPPLTIDEQNRLEQMSTILAEMYRALVAPLGFNPSCDGLDLFAEDNHQHLQNVSTYQRGIAALNQLLREINPPQDAYRGNEPHGDNLPEVVREIKRRIDEIEQKILAEKKALAKLEELTRKVREVSSK